jgi:hypothetical protein
LDIDVITSMYPIGWFSWEIDPLFPQDIARLILAQLRCDPDRFDEGAVHPRRNQRFYGLGDAASTRF